MLAAPRRLCEVLSAIQKSNRGKLSADNAAKTRRDDDDDPADGGDDAGSNGANAGGNRATCGGGDDPNDPTMFQLDSDALLQAVTSNQSVAQEKGKEAESGS